MVYDGKVSVCMNPYWCTSFLRHFPCPFSMTPFLLFSCVGKRLSRGIRQRILPSYPFFLPQIPNPHPRFQGAPPGWEKGLEKAGGKESPNMKRKLPKLTRMMCIDQYFHVKNTFNYHYLYLRGDCWRIPNQEGDRRLALVGKKEEKEEE